MRYLVAIIREIEVEAYSESDAKYKAIELDGRPGEVMHVQVERVAPLTEAERVANG